ncbi:glucose/arabinose dehydrogenase [Terracoccus luteus]|uniref:Glucose/arabinose dehydrogenase n=1 Tax=Terracoccus luteus TaxID=53356 RepID=A0A495XY31_9MICO|nr:PQQ-dependent sugar dehydrogenase [Terracoccus luteus]RKT77403.1 glucose/arabinose dehydrogenase [Terracoccus luteus]
MTPTRRPLRRALVALALLPLALGACSSTSGPDVAGAGPSATGSPVTSSATAPTAAGSSAPSSGATGTTTTSESAGAGGGAGATTTASASPSGAPTPAAVTAPTDVLTGLVQPWSVAVLPDGSALVSERNDGRVHRVPAPGSGGRATVVGTLPITRTAGEGGLLGLAVGPDFATDPVVYAYYSTQDDNRIARVPLADDRLGEPEVVFDGIPNGRNHNGGRIAFGPDGYLYVGTGEAGDTSLSQNLDSLGGKILRITKDGEPAPGNPFGGSPVWSYGHRNVQGLAWDSRKRLWASEFGANTYDELNLIEPGGNYGWPQVEGRAGDDSYVDPVAQWPTAEMSPSGIAIGPDGAVYMAALRGESVWRVPVDADGAAGTPQRLLEGDYGRVRDIHFVGGGTAWIVTGNGDGDRVVALPAASVGVA